MPKPLYLPIVLALAATVVAICSCATPKAPPTIWDWAPVRAPPVPGTGLPRPGMPVVVKPAPEPQPQPARLLPHTAKTQREDTIWASQDPSTGPAALLLGIPIAGPTDQSARAKTVWCAAKARASFKEEAYAKRDPDWLKCFANVLVQACLDAGRGNVDRRIEANTTQPFDRERLAEVSAAAEFAAKEVQRLCPSPLDPETFAASHSMHGIISKINWGTPQ